MVTVDEVVDRYYQRRKNRGPEINTAHQVRDAYNGEIALPLPELNRNEKAAVANLIRLGINQDAMRTSSTLPTLWCPPTRLGIKKSENDADDRRRTFAGWWQMNDFKKKQYRRCRHFIAYASTPVLIRPDFKRGVPAWHVCDPLSTYPAPSGDLDDMEPSDTIFCYQRTFSWLRAQYADAVNLAGLNGMRTSKPDDRYDILEYVDDETHMLVVLGARDDMMAVTAPASGGRYRLLAQTPNLAGVCTAVVPGRVTLDRPQGQFDGMLPLFIKRARLAALEEIAIEKGVFENEWFVQDTPDGDIITEADGREGIVGHVKGGKMMWHTLNPGYKTDQALDRLERQERVEGPIPAEFGGESASNVRTDRRGNTILSATIDYSIAETHDLLAESYRKEFQRAVAVSKAYFGDTPKSFYVNWKGVSGPVTYTPNRLFADSDEVVVRWSMPGSDVNSLTVGGGQRVGMGTLSKRGFMELDPLVDDVEEEHDRIVGEGLEAAVLAALQQQASAGSIPPGDLARIMQLVLSNRMELAEAVQQTQDEAQKRQATQVPAGSPAAQPGLAQVGAGAESSVAPIDASPNEQGLSALMSALRGPGRVGPLERGTAGSMAAGGTAA